MSPEQKKRIFHLKKHNFYNKNFKFSKQKKHLFVCDLFSDTTVQVDKIHFPDSIIGARGYRESGPRSRGTHHTARDSDSFKISRFRLLGSNPTYLLGVASGTPVLIQSLSTCYDSLYDSKHFPAQAWLFPRCPNGDGQRLASRFRLKQTRTSVA